MTLLVHPFSRKNLESKITWKSGLHVPYQLVWRAVCKWSKSKQWKDWLHWGTLALCWQMLLTELFFLRYSSWMGTGREAVSPLDGWSLCLHASEISSKPNDAEPEAQEEYSSLSISFSVCLGLPPHMKGCSEHLILNLNRLSLLLL